MESVGRVERILVGLCLAVLAGCPGGSGGEGADPQGTILKRLPGGDGPAGGPNIASVRFPPDPAGDITMDVAVSGSRGAPVQVTLEVSRDGGQTFKAASADAAGDTGDGVAVLWHSIADVGFRDPKAATLR